MDRPGIAGAVFGLAALLIGLSSVPSEVGAQTTPSSQRTPTPAAPVGPGFVMPLPPLEPSVGGAAEPLPAEVPPEEPPAAAPPGGGSGQPAGPASTGPVWVVDPKNVLLRLSEDMGKEIEQLRPKSGKHNGAAYSEVWFERKSNRIDDLLGPINVFNKVYIAPDLATGQQIYQEEVARQKGLPEAQVESVDIYAVTGVENFGDEQDLLATCNTECADKELDGTHWRMVVRNRNAVIVLYFYGGPHSATSTQMNQWLAKMRERLS
jgi:hypothetical protein